MRNANGNIILDTRSMWLIEFSWNEIVCPLVVAMLTDLLPPTSDRVFKPRLTESRNDVNLLKGLVPIDDDSCISSLLGGSCTDSFDSCSAGNFFHSVVLPVVFRCTNRGLGSTDSC